jgi:hypothetical protein
VNKPALVSRMFTSFSSHASEAKNDVIAGFCKRGKARERRRKVKHHGGMLESIDSK